MDEGDKMKNDFPKSKCCKANIMGVKDYGTFEGQLGIHKLHFCDKCKTILEGEGVGGIYEPKKYQ